MPLAMETMYENCVKIKSRAGIEYIGLLHSIDTEHSTVTLKRVHLLNPSTEITSGIRLNKFDYVIFRGGDIEDVQLSFKVRRTITSTHDAAIARVNFRPFILNTGYAGSASKDEVHLHLKAASKHDPAIVRINRKVETAHSHTPDTRPLSPEKTTAEGPSVSEIGDHHSQPSTSPVDPLPVMVPPDNQNTKLRRSQSIEQAARSQRPLVAERRCQSAEGSLVPSVHQVNPNQSKEEGGDSERRGVTKEYIPNSSERVGAYDKHQSFFDRLSTGIVGSRPASKRTSPSLEAKSTTNPQQSLHGKSNRRISHPHFQQEGFSVQPLDDYSMPYYLPVAPQIPLNSQPNVHPAYHPYYSPAYTYRQQLFPGNVPYFLNWQPDYAPLRYTTV